MICLHYLINQKKLNQKKKPQCIWKKQNHHHQIQQLQKIDFEKQIQIREDDIDSNGHVNNCVYPMWAMETFNEQFKKDFVLDEMEINFKKPIFKQDNIITAKIQKNTDTDFTISIGTTEKEAALVKTKFLRKIR